MMKKMYGAMSFLLLTWIALLPGPASIFAQNISIDRESVPVQYYRMPDRPLDTSYKTFSCEIDAYGADLMKSGITEATLENQYLVLDGYAKVGRNEGDVQLEVEVSQFTVLGEHHDTRRKKSKDKNGNEVTSLLYWLEVKYALPVTLAIKDKNGHILDDRYIFSLSDQRTYTSPTFNSPGSLDDYWRIEKTRRLQELHKTFVSDAFKKINELINTAYGYRRVTEDNVRFETVGKKKHPDYQRFQNTLEIVRKGFAQMDPDKSLESVAKSVQPAIIFYETQDKLYSTGDQEEQKLKHICRYNLALLHLWLEEFANARVYAEGLQALDEKDRDAKKLLEDIDEVESSLARVNKQSRHMVKLPGT